MTVWAPSHRFDRRALPLADRHYNRRKVGSPQFVPPGRCLVLLTPSARALWVTSAPIAAYVRHQWAGAWVCSLFRNESDARSSDLIDAAMRETITRFPITPRVPSWVCYRSTPHVAFVRRTEVAIVTFVDPRRTRKKRDPGRCYRRAGWLPCGMTKKDRLLAFALESDHVDAMRGSSVAHRPGEPAADDRRDEGENPDLRRG